MKLLTILPATLLMLATIGAQAQTKPMPVPEFKNKVMYQKKDSTLSDLDNTDMQAQYKPSMTGSASTFIMAAGTTSAVKRVGSPANKFIVKIDADVDPENVVELLKFTVDKKNRKIIIASYVMGTAKDVTLPKQKLTFTKVGDGVWIVSPAAQLEAGEYAFFVNRPNVDILGSTGGKPIKGNCFFVE